MLGEARLSINYAFFSTTDECYDVIGGNVLQVTEKLLLLCSVLPPKIKAYQRVVRRSSQASCATCSKRLRTSVGPLSRFE